MERLDQNIPWLLGLIKVHYQLVHLVLTFVDGKRDA